MTPAQEIAALSQRILKLAPDAGLYVGIKISPANCLHCGQPLAAHEPSGCCGDGGGSTYALAPSDTGAKS